MPQIYAVALVIIKTEKKKKIQLENRERNKPKQNYFII